MVRKFNDFFLGFMACTVKEKDKEGISLLLCLFKVQGTMLYCAEFWMPSLCVPVHMDRVVRGDKQRRAEG